MANKMHEEKNVHPIGAWVLRHELISSCCFTLALGLVIGGVTAVLERLLV